LSETLFTFPVGPRLNVWLRPGVGVAAFRHRLADIDARLEVQPLAPTLHDAAVRDLALAAAEQGADGG
jgi:hypothetical protein